MSHSIHEVYNTYFQELSLLPTSTGDNVTKVMKLGQPVGLGHIDRIITAAGIEIVQCRHQLHHNHTIRVEADSAFVELTFLLHD
ncbi:hypothetical protein M6D81_21420 [Paenibacillus sp. J5C_2022]|uniref:hypothetical protein n=1 Tax=Paenibacillus sp. J5C2022 TaxID=2977129 RepID=UPI0021CE20A4|nr:hypothetical protein [Paenibacillus sp. J5C2022]MCU6711256.1 hypothetical protein [Paenibacillus sp. J5C2022]